MAFGIRQTDFATECRITPGYLSNMESGRKQPADDLMARMAAQLGVGLHEITYVITSETTDEEAA